MSEPQYTPPHIRRVLEQVLLATARQREQMLPEPIGIVLPGGEGFAGLTHIAGLPVILHSTAMAGLIIPLEASDD